MNIPANIQDILNRLDLYKNNYFDESLIKRFLGLRKALYMMADEKRTCSPALTWSDESNVETRCKYCAGTGILTPQKWVGIGDKLNSHRMAPNVLIDQCPVTSVDLVRRVIMMHDLGDLNGKKILCIGDNDFASLLISLTCAPKEVVVIEKDERVIDYIQTEAEKESLPISVVKFDIRTINQIGCPTELRGQFDVFETDPPYTEVGMKFYVFLGMQALKRDGIGYIVVPHMRLEDWSDELMFSVQEFLLENGFVLTDVLPRSQTFQHEFEVISSIVRCKRLCITPISVETLRGLNVDRFYTIR